MKKNLFLLFCVYFFVVQAVIIGIIWQEFYMYILAFINLVAIALILILYKAFGLNEDGENRSAPRSEEKEVVRHHEPIHVKKSEPKGKAAKLILALFLFILFYVLLVSMDFGFRVIVASGISLILMLIVALFGGIANHFFKYLGNKILLILLGFGIVVFGYQFSFQLTSDPLGLGAYIWDNVSSLGIFEKQTTPADDAYLLSGEGTVLGSGMMSGEVSEDVLNLLSGVSSDIISGTVETPPVQPAPQGVSVHMGEMIKYILTSHNVTLSDKKDIKFVYVSFGNELYPYFRTAYANAMIGTTTNPSKLALCETYMVMKGILEKWPVTYTKANVLQKYRDYAVANDKLNGCVKGSVLKDSNL